MGLLFLRTHRQLIDGKQIHLRRESFRRVVQPPVDYLFHAVPVGRDPLRGKRPATHRRHMVQPDAPQQFLFFFHGGMPGKINERIRKGHENLRQADWILITWGSSFVYTWKENGKIVGNCHKLPARLFERKRIGTDEIVEAYLPLLRQIKTLRPQLQCLFTVSPIRHLKDGLHGNQLSKANLLLAADKICQELDFCHYFPSYEIMMDELRDYRFYADDMMHPSALAIQYIWECFSNTYFTSSTLSFLKEWEKIRRGLAHRPFNPETEAYQTFLSQILLKIEELKEKLPYLDVQKEIKLCQAQLKK